MMRRLATLGSLSISVATDEKTEVSGSESDRRPRLFAIWPGGMVVRELPERGVLDIGRGEEAAVRIDHASVSRRQRAARLHVGDELRLEDLASSNGTFVEGKRLAKSETVTVGSGSFIEIGTVMVVIRGPGMPLAPAGASQEDAGLVVCDPEMDRVHQLVELAARSNLSILLLGETGVGKDVIASRVHRPFGAEGDALPQDQLRGAPRDAARERAVRPREGRVHRRRPARSRACFERPTAARSSSTRSARCRSRCRPSSCASLEDGEVDARRRHARRCTIDVARRRRDQPRPRRRGRARAASARTSSSASTASTLARPAAARAPERRSSLLAAALRRAAPPRWTAARRPHLADGAMRCAAALPVAGQRARAEEPRRARARPREGADALRGRSPLRSQWASATTGRAVPAPAPARARSPPSEITRWARWARWAAIRTGRSAERADRAPLGRGLHRRRRATAHPRGARAVRRQPDARGEGARHLARHAGEPAQRHQRPRARGSSSRGLARAREGRA